MSDAAGVAVLAVVVWVPVTVLIGALARRAGYRAGWGDGYHTWPQTDEAAIVEAATYLQERGVPVPAAFPYAPASVRAALLAAAPTHFAELSRVARLEAVAAAAAADRLLVACWDPQISHASTGGGDLREHACGSCAPCRLAAALFELDGVDR